MLEVSFWSSWGVCTKSLFLSIFIIFDLWEYKQSEHHKELASPTQDLTKPYKAH